MQGRRVYLEITDRRWISFPTTKYASLAYASQVELEKVTLQDEGRSIRWETIDEQIEVEDVAHHRYVHTARADFMPVAGVSAGKPEPSRESGSHE